MTFGSYVFNFNVVRWVVDDLGSYVFNFKVVRWMIEDFGYMSSISNLVDG